MNSTVQNEEFLMEKTLSPNVLSVKENLGKVYSNVVSTCHLVNRKPSDIEVLAVSKAQSLDRIQGALDEGHRIFGENRVQEAKEKWPILRSSYPDIKLHLIGSLQRNKVIDAVALFDVIETVDRPALAAALFAEERRSGKRLSYFVQVNTGNESQKNGINPEYCKTFVEDCRMEYNLNVVGLMCIPPLEEEPSLHFSLLEKLAKSSGLENLSMGMSNDYGIAIEFGATHIRVGEAIFGPRGNANR